MKKFASKLSLLALLAALAMPLVACDHNGPAEEMGENINNAAENMGNAVENATNG